MNENSLIARLQLIFRGVLGPDIVLTDDLDASKVPEWDSLNHISLIVAIESEFDVELSAEELAKLLNVGDMVKLLTTKINSKS